MDAFRLVLHEPNESFRTTLAAVVRGATHTPRLVVDETDSAKAFFHALEDQRGPYDVALVNLDALHKQSTVVLPKLIVDFPLTSFVVYSASNSLVTARQAQVAGAAGYFRRDSPPELVLQVLGIVVGGEAFAIPDHLRSGSITA